MKKKAVNKVVLAYSGGLDTSVMMKWLIEQYGCEVVAFTADVGQGAELDGLEAKALGTGASQIYVEDLRSEFVRDYVFTAVKAGAVYEHYYLLGTSIARPLIAKRHIEIAHKVGADAVAHGATGKGNDQLRFELGYYALNPDITVIAPWRHWSFRSRSELIDYAKKHDIAVPVSKDKPYSMDANLMHISYEGGILEDPWREAPNSIYQLTVNPEDAPAEALYVTIDFEAGVPVAVDGVRLDPVALLEKLNRMAGAHGIGRVDIVENRYVGMKSRGCYETPGVTVLQHAHRAVESLTLDREVMHLKAELSLKYARLIYNGFWFSPEFKVLTRAIDETQARVTGTARLKLYKGSVAIVGRRSPYTLYHEQLATFEEDDVYCQADAEGFIKLNALRLRVLREPSF